MSWNNPNDWLKEVQLIPKYPFSQLTWQRGKREQYFDVSTNTSSIWREKFSFWKGTWYSKELPAFMLTVKRACSFSCHYRRVICLCQWSCMLMCYFHAEIDTHFSLIFLINLFSYLILSFLFINLPPHFQDKHASRVHQA